jgi:hypothetical protein
LILTDEVNGGQGSAVADLRFREQASRVQSNRLDKYIDGV